MTTGLKMLSLGTLFAVAACGAPSGTGGTNPAPTSTTDANSKSPFPGWTTLVQQGWVLGAGLESLPSYYFTAGRDYNIHGIRPIVGPGLHHLDIQGPGPPHNLMYTAPPGVDPLIFPDGVGLHYSQGDQIQLDLHLLNATSAEINGTSGIAIMELDGSAVTSLANVLTPANTQFTLPTGKSHQTATCTLTFDQTLFAIAPHMHSLGKHLTTTLVQGSQSQVLFDADFDFNRQVYTSFTPIAAHAGDKITVDCSYDNTTGKGVGWGIDFKQEMCQSMVYRYPAGDGNFCTQ